MMVCSDTGRPHHQMDGMNLGASLRVRGVAPRFSVNVRAAPIAGDGGFGPAALRSCGVHDLLPPLTCMRCRYCSLLLWRCTRLCGCSTHREGEGVATVPS